MSFKKIAAILAAASALAALSVPAMAMENEFHGTYTAKWFVDNYEKGGSGFIMPNGAVVPTSMDAIVLGTTGLTTYALPATKASTTYSLSSADGLTTKYAKTTVLDTPGFLSYNNNVKTNNYFEQRARLFYTAKASDDLKLVLGFEIDSVWGDRAQGALTNANSTTFNTSGYNGAYRNSGGALESDAVNLETKHVYLDFKIPSTPTRATVGIQAFKDGIKGILFDVDAAGIKTVTKAGPATIGLHYIRGYDQFYFGTSKNTSGMDTLQLVALTADVAVNKNFNVGFQYYLLDDGRSQDGITNSETFYSTTAATAVGTKGYSNRLDLHTFALNFDGKVGPVTLSGFVAEQIGHVLGTYAFNSDGTTAKNTHVVLNGWAANLAAKADAGPGTFRTAFLFTSGDNGKDKINGAWQSLTYSINSPSGNGGTNTAGNTYNEANMMLLNRNGLQHGNTTSSTDMSLAYTTNNRNQGMYLYSLGYDAKLGAKAYLNTNLGFLWSAKNNDTVKPVDLSGTVAALNSTGTAYTVTNYLQNGATRRSNGTNFQGTELNLELGYKMYDNLTFKIQAAYVWLGGYYNNSVYKANTYVGLNGQAQTYGTATTPDNPYTVRTGLSYTF